jgi:hypothetical protein
MKLIRKEDAPVIIDQWGIEHPDITIKIVGTPEDKLRGWLRIECAYFHNDNSLRSLEQFGFDSFSFLFNDRSWSEDDLDWETYTQIKQDIEIDSNGNIVLMNQDVPNWILNQPWVLDFEGKKFFTDMEKLTDIQFQEKYNINSKKSFIDNFMKYSPKGCIMGFITKEMALKKRDEIFNYSNHSVQGDSKRNYIDFFIKDGIPFSDLSKYI